jgi:hypothetical protein
VHGIDISGLFGALNLLFVAVTHLLEAHAVCQRGGVENLLVVMIGYEHGTQPEEAYRVGNLAGEVIGGAVIVHVMIACQIVLHHGQ